MSNSKAVITWRVRIKAHLLEGFNSKCGICSYNKYQGALEFHHLDPKEKDFGFGQISSRSWNFLVKEAKKCVCLCSVCHKEVHAGVTKIPSDIQMFDESFVTYEKYATLRNNKNSKK